MGVNDAESENRLREIYQPLLSGAFHCLIHPSGCPAADAPFFLVTTLASAELIKHASNSFLGPKISYANVISDLCEKLDGNVEEVARAMGLDPRIGPQFLNAGLGFGGFCLRKDIQAFVRLAHRHGVEFSLLREAEQINKRRIDKFLEKVRHALWAVKDKKIGVLGLAFKPNTDDVRFAPAIEVVRRLVAEGAKVRATDPVAIERASGVLSGARLLKDPYEVAKGADALLLLTEWSDYRDLDWSRMYSLMARPLVLYARNALVPEKMKTHGFEYHSFGRPDLIAKAALVSS